MKKLSILIFTVICFTNVTLFSQDEKISAGGMKFFEGTWAEVLTAAKEQNKYVMVDAFADWCVPCKWMVANVFNTEAAGSFYNDKFIMYKFDMEKGEGPEFAEKYAVDLYPTYLFFSPEGELVHRSTGSKPVEMFIEDGKNALNPNKQSSNMAKRYANGERDADFLYEYAFSLAAVNPMSPETQEVVKAYLMSQKDEDLINEKNWKVINMLVYDANSPAFKYLEINKDKFAVKYGEQYVYEKIAMTKMNNYYSLKQYNEYAKEVSDYMDKYPSDNSEVLNNFAWNFYENVNDKAMLKKAEKWAKKSMELDKNYYNTDTYAAVLYKLGKYEKALKYTDEAIKLAKQSNQDYKGTEELKKKIEKKLDE
jgi:thiol-disulfide isomerase/thioredoxin